MALSAAALKTQIRSELDAAFGAPADASMADKLATAVANAVVNYLLSAAQVTAVTTCPAGPGTATGTLT